MFFQENRNPVYYCSETSGYSPLLSCYNLQVFWFCCWCWLARAFLWSDCFNPGTIDLSSTTLLEVSDLKLSSLVLSTLQTFDMDTSDISSLMLLVDCSDLGLPSQLLLVWMSYLLAILAARAFSPIFWSASCTVPHVGVLVLLNQCCIISIHCLTLVPWVCSMQSKMSLLMFSCSPSRYQCLKPLSSAESWLKLGRHVSALFCGESNPVGYYN